MNDSRPGRKGFVAVVALVAGLGHAEIQKADTSSIALPAVPSLRPILRAAVVGRGEIAFAELLHAPQSYAGKYVRLDGVRVRLVAYPRVGFRGNGPNIPGRLAEHFIYGFNVGGSNACELISASDIEAPPGDLDFSVSGVWTRLGTNWASNSGSNRSASVWGLRVATVTFTNGLAGAIERRADYPVHPANQAAVSDLMDRCQKLIDALTRYEAESARKRLAQLFPPPGEPLALPADVRERLEQRLGPAPDPDNGMLQRLRQLHEDLVAAAHILGEPRNDPGFAARRTGVVEAIVLALEDLCEGPFPGCIDADRFRYWYVNRLISSGELVEAQAALGEGAVPLALEAEAAPASALLKTLGQRVPEFQVTQENGSTVTAKSFRGKWAVLYFKTGPGPSGWHSYYRGFIKLLDDLAADPAVNLTYAIVPMDRNRDSGLIKSLHITGEPQILLLSPGGHLCYFNRPTQPQIPTDAIFRVWVQGRPGGRSGAARVLEKLGVDPLNQSD